MRNHHDQLRRLLPGMTVDKATAEAKITELNAGLSAEFDRHVNNPQLGW